MRISIVIATFNRDALLRITLDDLRRQAFEPGDELIVVDNASTDDTAQVIAAAAEGFPVRVQALREPTPGKSPALIAGLAVATGDIVALTDDDVVVADDWLTSIRRVFAESAVDLIGGRVEPEWARPAPRWLRVEEDGRYGPLASPLALLHYGTAQALGGRTAVGANMAIRRDVLQALGGFAPHLGRRAGTLLCGEDHDLCLRATAAGYRCEYRPEVRVRHWVPASRLRLPYYARWFYWSGVTHAMLERGTIAGARAIPPYLVRRVLAAPPAAAGYLLAGRPAAAVTALMDGVWAFGNLVQRARDRWRSTPMTRPDDAAGTMAGGGQTHTTVRRARPSVHPAGANQS